MIKIPLHVSVQTYELINALKWQLGPEGGQKLDELLALMHRTGYVAARPNTEVLPRGTA